MGTLLFDLSYVALWGAAGVSAVILRKSLAQVIALGAGRSAPRVPAIPTFDLPLLGSRKTISSKSVTGRPFGLFFVQSVATWDDDHLQRTARSLNMCREIIRSNHVDFDMFIVSVGTSGPVMRGLADEAQLRGVKILQDADASFVEQCGVAALPSCLMYGEDGRLVKTGYASPDWIP